MWSRWSRWTKWPRRIKGLRQSEITPQLTTSNSQGENRNHGEAKSSAEKSIPSGNGVSAQNSLTVGQKNPATTTSGQTSIRVTTSPSSPNTSLSSKSSQPAAGRSAAGQEVEQGKAGGESSPGLPPGNPVAEGGQSASLSP